MSIIAWLWLALLIVFLTSSSVQCWRMRPKQPEEFDTKEKKSSE